MPELFADERGIWVRNDPAWAAYGLEWDEIYLVGGYPIDAIERTLIYVEVDPIYGQPFEFNNEWRGFEEVVEALTQRLPGLAPSWFQTIASLPLEQSITVWRRV